MFSDQAIVNSNVSNLLPMPRKSTAMIQMDDSYLMKAIARTIQS